MRRSSSLQFIAAPLVRTESPTPADSLLSVVLTLCSFSLILLVVAMGVLVSADVDGNPATSNLPLVVLASSTSTDDDGIHRRRAEPAPVCHRSLAALSRRFTSWFEGRLHPTHLGVQPIRGP